MRSKLPAATYLLALCLSFGSAWTAQDDIDDNEDLRPTPEEQARLTIMKRWPDAMDIDIVDEAGEADAEADADDDAKAKPEADADADADADVDADADADADPKPAEDALAVEPDDAADNWTISATFTSGGSDFEVLLDDAGRVKYVYEELTVEKTPANVLEAAHKAAGEGEPGYIDKFLNECKEPAVLSYIIGLGHKEVQVDADGQVLKIDDLAKDAVDENDDADANDANLL